MKTHPFAALAAVAFAGVPATGVSAAPGEEVEITPWIDVGSAELMALETFSADIDLDGMPFQVVGFELRFDYFEVVADSSWASDLQVVLSASSGVNYTVGGLSNQPQSDVLWSFDGPVSDPPGHYGDDGNDIFLPWKLEPQPVGTYTIILVNDWTNDQWANRYDLVSIRFYTTELETCHGDIDLDGTVGFTDLLMLLNAWGLCQDCPADLDTDGEVDFADLLALLFAWGPCA